MSDSDGEDEEDDKVDPLVLVRQSKLRILISSQCTMCIEEGFLQPCLVTQSNRGECEGSLITRSVFGIESSMTPLNSSFDQTNNLLFILLFGWLIMHACMHAWVVDHAFKT